MQHDWRGYTAKVSDFGLSRLLPEAHIPVKDRMATDDVAGTVTHMSPELLSGGAMSAAADVYAFGILSKSAASIVYICFCLPCPILYTPSADPYMYCTSAGGHNTIPK